MLLWDLEMKDDLARLADIPAGRLLDIAVTEVERTAGIVLPDASGDAEAREVYERCLAALHQAQAAGGAAMPVLDDELQDELFEASESSEWGVGPLMAAVDQCVGEEPATPMDSECAAEVLGLCYQAVMEYQQIDDITPDTERRYPALLDTISTQQSLIRAAVSRP
ncbi:MAG: hypothetical protein FWE15_01005 [Actinomycetia bacterium]|nr:hypothetical protein [Actinomycetes bacterium]MCL2728582.1 hypothetical protein [Actinomycetes bacterium]